MENNKINKVLLIICFGLFVSLGFSLFRGETKVMENENLKKENSAKEAEIKEIKKERDKYQQQKDSLSSQIATSKTTINNITIERDKKTSEVSKMGNKSLTEYFEKRYDK